MHRIIQDTETSLGTSGWVTDNEEENGSHMDVLIICSETLRDWCRHTVYELSPRRSVHTISPGQNEHQFQRLECHLFCKEGA